jgi:hypothetical protein
MSKQLSSKELETFTQSNWVLARRGRRGRGITGQILTRGGIGGGGGLAHEHQELKARQGWVCEEERVTGVGFPMVAEAVAEGSSSAGCFPARRAVKS